MENKTFAIEWRATLIQQAKALEIQRATILAQVAILERMYNITERYIQKIPKAYTEDTLTSELKYSKD